MAEKMFFISDKNSPFIEEIISYSFVPGFSLCQKKKNIDNLHTSIIKKYPNKRILEVSSKSKDELGRKLSAFNLKYKNHFVESIFQSSKCFENGLQFNYLINKKPSEAKKYIKEFGRGRLEKFNFNGRDYPLSPKTAFYDYIYILALKENNDLSYEIIKYDIFTDVEFNFKKSINCQARACSIYKYMILNNSLDYYLESFEKFVSLYEEFLIL